MVVNLNYSHMFTAIKLKSRAIVVVYNCSTHVKLRGCGWLSMKLDFHPIQWRESSGKDVLNLHSCISVTDKVKINEQGRSIGTGSLYV